MTVLTAAVALLFAGAGDAQQFTAYGFLSGRGAYVSGQRSWLEGGFGRLDIGASSTDSHRNLLLGIGQAGADWTPSEHFDVHVQGIARTKPENHGGRAAGMVEAYADARAFFGEARLQLRAGEFFLPTSRENREALWTSPYTITLSALNSWIAQEFRPIGADLEWKRGNATAAATAFRGNDSSGALLGWRGWALGSRLTVYNEVVPLPPLFSFPTSFAGQRGDGTKPFGSDLDGRTGFAGRFRYSSPGRGMLQYAFADNRGDRRLHRAEYAWATRFHIVSGEVGSPDTTILAAEYIDGRTGMGMPPGGFVEAGFHSGYALVSHRIGNERFSARIDAFSTSDRDRSAAETNSESGRAWTLAWLHDIRGNWRTALEFTQVTGRRLAAEESGYDGNTDSRSVMVELRYHFSVAR